MSNTDVCLVLFPTSILVLSRWVEFAPHAMSSSDWQQLEVKCEYKSACGRAKREVLFFNSKIKSSIYIYIIFILRV